MIPLYAPIEINIFFCCCCVPILSVRTAAFCFDEDAYSRNRFVFFVLPFFPFAGMSIQAAEKP